MILLLIAEFIWSKDKNEWLKKKRSISFEEIAGAMDEGSVVADHPHPNSDRYPNQRIAIVAYNYYGYVVPYVRTGEVAFLKTVIPSRKMTKKYNIKKKKGVVL